MQKLLVLPFVYYYRYLTIANNQPYVVGRLVCQKWKKKMSSIQTFGKEHWCAFKHLSFTSFKILEKNSFGKTPEEK